jgi:CheY-like chemotaxis protein
VSSILKKAAKCFSVSKQILGGNAMSADTPILNEKGAQKGRFGPDGRDRRKRHRAKMVMPVQIRGGKGSLDQFEDVGKTIDASRDGLLVATKRGGYWDGQLLDVTIGAGGDPTAVLAWQPARVVRTQLMQDHLSYALALEYQGSAIVNANGEHISSFLPMVVRVLVVESNLRVAGATRELLEQDGYEVVHVSNGKEALEVLHTEIPDVVLAEVDGGEVNGTQLCVIVKTSVRLQHIPVILLSRSGQPADYSACHKAGAVMCMAMPCAPGKLQHAVRLVSPPPSMRSSYVAKVPAGGKEKP